MYFDSNLGVLGMMNFGYDTHLLYVLLRNNARHCLCASGPQMYSNLTFFWNCGLWLWALGFEVSYMIGNNYSWMNLALGITKCP